MTVLVLTYHAIEPGPPPLCLDEALFYRQLESIEGSGATALTISGLAASLARDDLPERAVAITFDDGFASLAAAAPLLAEHGFPATAFCVAGHIGGASDWPSQPSWAPARPLASIELLRDLAASGLEIGCHGLRHEPLVGASASLLEREIVEARERLEQALGIAVLSFAYPYGVLSAAARALVEQSGYEAACTSRLRPVAATCDPYAIPRIDAHYLRSPERLARLLAGRDTLYLGARRVAARARRLLGKGYASPPAA
jgi:peptidoglycan/xylan/chitin deacetylase (PgdA/CDA1 family)